MRTVAIQLLEFKNISMAGAFLIVGGMASLHSFSFVPNFGGGSGDEEIGVNAITLRSPRAEKEAIERFLKARYKGKGVNVTLLARLIRDEAHAHGFPPSVILSLIESESGFRTAVVSNRRAFGLMQVRFPTALEIAKRHRLTGFHSRTQLLDPAWNIRIGVRYLAELKKRFGRVDHALGAYNLGPRKYRDNLRSRRPQPTMVVEYIDGILSRQSQYEMSHGLARLPACSATSSCGRAL